MNTEQVAQIMEACHTSPKRTAVAYAMRLFAPLVMFIPIAYWGMSIGALVFSVIAYRIAMRTIEHSYHNEFAALYSIRHFNLMSRGR